MDVIDLLISDHRLIQRLADDLCRPGLDAEESAAIAIELSEFVQFHFGIEEMIFREMPIRGVAVEEVLIVHRKIEKLLTHFANNFDLENSSQAVKLLRNQLSLTHRMEEKLIFARMKLDLPPAKIKRMTELYLGYGKQFAAA